VDTKLPKFARPRTKCGALLVPLATANGSSRSPLLSKTHATVGGGPPTFSLTSYRSSIHVAVGTFVFWNLSWHLCWLSLGSDQPRVLLAPEHPRKCPRFKPDRSKLMWNMWDALLQRPARFGNRNPTRGLERTWGSQFSYKISWTLFDQIANVASIYVPPSMVRPTIVGRLPAWRAGQNALSLSPRYYYIIYKWIFRLLDVQ
jgi:hypothetical protein